MCSFTQFILIAKQNFAKMAGFHSAGHIVLDTDISDAPIPILVSVSALFWQYRTCIGKAINA